MKEARRWGSLAILSVLLLGIGAAMALPDLGCGSSMKSNGTAAIATLRNLVSVQARFQAFAACDADGDGTGEYGTFAEMTGAAGVRGDPLGATRRPRLAEFILSPALANVDGDGMVTKSGYHFRILLPARGGGAAHETRPGALLDRPVDADLAETSWCAYAWPVSRTAKGSRVFFVTGKGNVFQTPNEELRYHGTDAPPAWDGAFPAGTGNGWSAPAEGARYTGRDGNAWKPVN